MFGLTAFASADLRQLEAVLLEHVGIVGALGSIKDFNTDNAPLLVIIHDDAVGDLFAFLDAPVGRLR